MGDPLYCPACKRRLVKIRLDRYYCGACDQDWLIHAFGSRHLRAHLNEVEEEPVHV